MNGIKFEKSVVLLLIKQTNPKPALVCLLSVEIKFQLFIEDVSVGWRDFYGH